MPDDSIPGPTPTGYQRTQGGSFKWVPPTAEELSKLLPQYEVERLAGRGGMGAVYKGKQKALERSVAIKILPPEVDAEDDSYTQRFKNEAKIMAKLEHPAIVPVHDFGETSTGLLYFVMGFVDGTDVHQMIQSQGRLPPEHALAITAHVCDALAYAHKNGIIHRDIKPSNVLINMDGQVKVADFGLAKVDDPSQSSGLTKTGLAMGTPDYVAPETLTLGMTVDGRVDLYAVGVMLYQMLTGRVPRGTFDSPSKLTGCDPRFDSIVFKATKYDREERYDSAADLRKALDVILTTPLVQSGGQSSAAIPQDALPQKPVAKGPRKPMGKSANVPERKGTAQAVAGVNDPGSPGPLDRAATAKSKAPLFIGIGAVAAIAVGAFVMLGGGDKAKQSGPLSPLSGTSVPSASDSAQRTERTTLPPSTTPIKVRDEPKPSVAQASGLPPKPAAATAAPLSAASTPANAPTGKAAAPPAAATGLAMTNAGNTSAPAPANAALAGASALPVSASPAVPISNPKSPISNPAAPAAPISNPKSQISDSKFPPGQWVKVFTKFEDLPEDLRKPESGVKLEGGRLVISQAKGSTLTCSSIQFSGAGIRLRRSPSKTQMHLSLAKTDYTSVRLFAREDSDSVHLQRWCPPVKSGAKELGDIQTPRNVERSFELAVFGRTAVARVNDKLVSAVIPSELEITPFKPVVYFGDKADFVIRDIEVINLDGIPEAEALRILGVDEKGNDLRALAAKQEQQQKAQAEQQSAIDAIPELKTLHEQFVKLQAERVSAPSEKDVAALNTSYLGGLDREIEKEKKAGHLDGVLALEAEKKAVASTGSRSSVAGQGIADIAQGAATPGDARLRVPLEATSAIPAEDDEATPANLKALRKIYRDTFAKHEAARAANLKQLTDPLAVRLKQLESTLTQQNRIEHAKVVREYRERLGSAETGIAASTPSAVERPGDEARASPSGTPSQRAVVDWLINTVNASVTARTPKGNVTLKPGDEIPKGTFTVFKLTPAADDSVPWLITDEDLARIGELEELEEIQSPPCPNISGTGFAHLKKLKKLKKLILKCPNIVGANLAKLPNFPLLEELIGISNYTPDEFRAMPELKNWLRYNQTNPALLTRDHMHALAERKSIIDLNFSNAPISDDVTAPLAGMKQMEVLNLGNTKISGECLRYLSDLPKLREISIDAPTLEPQNIAMLANIKSLTRIWVRAALLVRDKEHWISLFAAMKSRLKDLEITYVANLPGGLPEDVLDQVKQVLPKTNVNVRK